MKNVWWVELSTDNLDDWKEAIRICGEAFAKTPWYQKRNADHCTSVAFANAYFQYLYETELSDGRAGLVCAKTKRSDGSIAIGYVASFIYNRLPPTEGDASAMERVSVEMMQENLEADADDEEVIHKVIRESAESLNLCYMYAIFDATSPEFAGQGVGRKFMDIGSDAIYYDGIRRGKLPRNMPCVLYGIIDDPRMAKVNRGRQKEIAHLHATDNAICMKSVNSETLCNDCVMVKGNQLSPGAPYDTLKKLGSIFKNNLTKYDCKL